ncbi:MAG TPA: NlpC/P60 family protein [Gaiellaceae bacterium]|nr:NlpC/P60 family protein [Gaiellaceae bacterium]
MRLRAHSLACLGAIALATVAVGAAEATPPQLAAKRAQAQRVLAQIDAIDARLSVVSEQFDGARVNLQRLRGELRVAQARLARARGQNRRAQLDEARLLVSLYTTGRPTTLEVLLGANSVADLLRLSDAEDAISREVAAVADAATKAKRRLAERVREVEADRHAAEQTVRELAVRRAQIERGLAQRRTLLASVRAQITRIEAQERARQARLAAAARARLAAAAARARAEAAAAARARALAVRRARAQAAVAAAAAAARRAQAAQQAQAAAAAAATTAVPATTTATVPPPQPVPADPASAVPAPTSGGHPQAAQIALRYIGVPYAWGGATPSGFDCSGLVTYVFAQLGVQLPHHAADQYTYGDPVPFDDLQPGDLVFFDALNHVGIYIGNGQYVDAPETGSFVKIESLSDPWAVANYVGARRI